MDNRIYIKIDEDKIDLVTVPDVWMQAFGYMYEEQELDAYGEPIGEPQVVIEPKILDYLNYVGNPGGEVRHIETGSTLQTGEEVLLGYYIIPIPLDRVSWEKGTLERHNGIKALKTSMDAVFQTFGTSWIQKLISGQELLLETRVKPQAIDEGIL